MYIIRQSSVHHSLWCNGTTPSLAPAVVPLSLPLRAAAAPWLPPELPTVAFWLKADVCLSGSSELPSPSSARRKRHVKVAEWTDEWDQETGGSNWK